jgi:hypothetical protein
VTKNTDDGRNERQVCKRELPMNEIVNFDTSRSTKSVHTAFVRAWLQKTLGAASPKAFQLASVPAPDNAP